MSQQPSGIICTPDELAFSLANPATLRCLTRGESLGLLITTLTAYVSLIAVVYVFYIILRNAILIQFTQNRGLKLFHIPMDVLMLSLFVADALQAIGGAVNAKWVNDGKVQAGTFCNAQGIIQNVGETGVALSNLAISLHTFFGLYLRNGISSKKLTLVAIACIWLFIAIIVAVGNATHHNPAFSSPAPYWCLISKQYLVWRIFAEYMWIWLALLLSLLVYIPLLWIRDISRDQRRQTFIFLAYPLSYCLCILPTSIARWNGFVQEAKYNHYDTPLAATFFASATFNLSGFINVILLLSTRVNCGLFGKLVFESPRRPPLPTGMESETTADRHQANGSTEEIKEEGRGRLT